MSSLLSFQVNYMSWTNHTWVECDQRVSLSLWMVEVNIGECKYGIKRLVLYLVLWTTEQTHQRTGVPLYLIIILKVFDLFVWICCRSIQYSGSGSHSSIILKLSQTVDKYWSTSCVQGKWSNCDLRNSSIWIRGQCYCIECNYWYHPIRPVLMMAHIQSIPREVGNSPSIVPLDYNTIFCCSIQYWQLLVKWGTRLFDSN